MRYARACIGPVSSVVCLTPVRKNRASRSQQADFRLTLPSDTGTFGRWSSWADDQAFLFRTEFILGRGMRAECKLLMLLVLAIAAQCGVDYGRDALRQTWFDA